MIVLRFDQSGEYIPPPGSGIALDLAASTAVGLDTAGLIIWFRLEGEYTPPSVPIDAPFPGVIFKVRPLFSPSTTQAKLLTTAPVTTFVVRRLTSRTWADGIVRPIFLLGTAGCSSTAVMSSPLIYTNPVLLYSAGISAQSRCGTALELYPEWYEPHKRSYGTILLSSFSRELRRSSLLASGPPRKAHVPVECAFDAPEEVLATWEMACEPYAWHRASVALYGDVADSVRSDITLLTVQYRFIAPGIEINATDILRGVYKDLFFSSHADRFWRRIVGIDFDDLVSWHRSWFLTYVIPRWMQRDIEIVSGKKYYDLNCGYRYIPPEPNAINFDLKETHGIETDPDELIVYRKAA